MIEGIKKNKILFASTIPLLFVGALGVHFMNVSKVTYDKGLLNTSTSTSAQNRGVEVSPEIVTPAWPLALDTTDYDKRLLVLANYVAPKPSVVTGTTSSTTPVVKPILPTYSSSSNVTIAGKRWPAAAAFNPPMRRMSCS